MALINSFNSAASAAKTADVGPAATGTEAARHPAASSAFAKRKIAVSADSPPQIPTFDIAIEGRPVQGRAISLLARPSQPAHTRDPAALERGDQGL